MVEKWNCVCIQDCEKKQKQRVEILSRSKTRAYYSLPSLNICMAYNVRGIFLEYLRMNCSYVLFLGKCRKNRAGSD